MNPLHRCALRFPRTAAEAFKDHTYGAAVEKPAPKGYGTLWWAVICAIAVVSAGLIVVQA